MSGPSIPLAPVSPLISEPLPTLGPQVPEVIVILTSTHPKLYRLLWTEDESMSGEYNHTWAKEHKRRIDKNEAVEDSI